MKNLLVAIFISMVLLGCSNNEIKSDNQISKSLEEKTMTNEQIPRLVEIVKDKKAEKNLRKNSFEYLKKNEYSSMKSLLEEITPGETDLRYDFLRESLRFKDFKYREQDIPRMLEILLENKDKAKYSEFFSKYNNETITISIDDCFNIEDAVFLKNEIDRKKMFNLILLSNHYNLYKKMAYLYPVESISFFSTKKNEWVTDLLKADKELFIKVKDEINSSNYTYFKPVLDFYLENISYGLEIMIAEIIINIEGNIEEKLLSQNYYVQITAIKKNGMDESNLFFEGKIEENNQAVYRGLAILKSPKLFPILKKKYEEEKKLVFLEYIYLLGEPKTNAYFKIEFLKQSIDDRISILNAIKIYSINDSVDVAFYFFSDSQSIEDRTKYIDFVILNNPDFFIKKASELIASNKYSADEKKHFKEKLSEVAGEETKDQILKSLENRIYSSKINEEKDTIAFSSKLKIWREYITLFPDSFYREEVEKKILSYENYLEKIKSDLQGGKETKLKKIDEQISEYKEYIRKETSMERVKQFKVKISQLEKEKLNIDLQYKKSDKDKLRDMEKDYKVLVEEINSILSQIATFKTEGKDQLFLREAERTYQTRNTERSELLEKIIIFYGYYVDKYGAGTLNEDILRDINKRVK